MTNSLQFLSGGGEMGALIRTHHWESSLLGPADKWPQSFRTTLSILLNSKFPMFLYWGADLICFYNDAYRFSLGNNGKHPLLLGMKGEDAFPETWPMVKPSIDQVLSGGEATWSEDQFIPIYREGALKDAHWTFSFSAVKDEHNLTAGVFLTLMETTEKVHSLKNLSETNDQLAFAIEATELGTFDLNPVTNKFVANPRLKDWFGLPQESEVDLLLATNVIVEKDRDRVVTAIEKALQYPSGGHYDIEFNIVHPVTKEERVVRAKGRAWFGSGSTAYRFNGTLQDITKEANDRSIIEASEKRLKVERKSLHDFFIQAPAVLAILKGPEHVFEFANPAYKELVGGRNPTGKTLLEALPEIEGQGFVELLDKVYKTGEAFIGKEIPASVNKGDGNLEQLYLNFTYQAFKNDHGEAEGILVFAYDVTEQVLGRKLMEASEKRFSNILSQSIMAIAILKGPEMTVTFANESIIAIWGKGPDVFGKPLVEVLPEIKDQVFPTLLNDVYTTGVPFLNSEISCILNRNGKMVECYFNLLYQPYRDVDNSISGITILATEVTDQVLAKKQFKEIDEEQKKLASHLKLATDSANLGIWSLDIASSKLEWSDMHKKLWGYGELLEELTFEDWHKAILPEDREFAFQKLEESKLNRGTYEVEYRIKKRDDGNIRSIRSVGKYYYNGQGEAETLTGISVDITEQKAAEEKIRQSEERFRNLAETIPQLIWITNEKGEYEYASNQWLKYSGLDPQLDETWPRLIHPDDMNDVVATWKHSLATGKPYQAEARLKNKQGEYLWHLVQGIATINQENKIVKWIGAFTNIHEQKINEEKKDEFISIASHEMKTPLTSAKGYLELLLMILKEENQTAFLYANKANQAVERLHSLVTELLDVSKIQNGQINYNITTFNFNEMLDEAIEEIQITAKRHSLQKNGILRQPVKGDKQRLQQVMFNLLSNAVKYSPGAEKVLINVVEQDENLLVSVQDFGVGMLARHVDKVFERYYRVREHAVYFQGLGIGLHISSNIIQRHQGKMWAESEPDKGSTFYFTIPL